MQTKAVRLALYTSIIAQDHDRHHAVHDAFEKAAGERALDDVDRFEAGRNIAQVALLEEAHGQMQQVMEQIARAAGNWRRCRPR